MFGKRVKMAAVALVGNPIHGISKVKIVHRWSRHAKPRL
jgi:hypothetical protein